MKGRSLLRVSSASLFLLLKILQLLIYDSKLLFTEINGKKVFCVFCFRKFYTFEWECIKCVVPDIISWHCFQIRVSSVYGSLQVEMTCKRSIYYCKQAGFGLLRQ